LALLFSSLTLAKGTIINGLDFGPLSPLAGTWKTIEAGGVDVAPAQAGSSTGKGALSATPYYEEIVFEPVADVKNASDQYLVAMYYRQEVFRKKDGSKFHDQRGYLIYDKKNQMVYNSFCLPRATCVVAEGKAGSKIEFTVSSRGIAESAYMKDNASTTNFTMTLDIKADVLKYNQMINLDIYGKTFPHTDSSTLKKIK